MDIALVTSHRQRGVPNELELCLLFFEGFVAVEYMRHSFGTLKHMLPVPPDVYIAGNG